MTVLEVIELDGYRTKRVAEILEGLGLSDSSVLIVIDEANVFVQRSARNLPRVTVLRVAGLNVYDVLRHSKLVLTRAAVAAIERRLGDAGGEAQA